jgi:hypothetical protein
VGVKFVFPEKKKRKTKKKKKKMLLLLLFLTLISAQQTFFTQTIFKGLGCKPDAVTHGVAQPDIQCNFTQECEDYLSSNTSVINFCSNGPGLPPVFPPEYEWVLNLNYAGDKPTCNYTPRLIFGSRCNMCVPGVHFTDSVFYNCSSHLASYYQESVNCTGQLYYYTWFNEECPARPAWTSPANIRIMSWKNSTIV